MSISINGFSLLNPTLFIIGFILIVISIGYCYFYNNKKDTEKFVLLPTIIPLLKANRNAKLSIYIIIKTTLYLTSLLILCLSVGRPVSYKKIESPKKLRNLILCLDLSPSMEERDYVVNGIRASRLTALLKVSKEFIKNVKSVRLGLVVFGGSAYLQSPLTPDTTSVLETVDSLRTGIAGKGTAIGDGLALSLKRIKNVPSTSSAVILFTDGRHNAGMIDPFESAKIARDLDIRIHTIGIGGLKDSVSSVDEKTLKKIAEATKGTYAYAKSTESLRKIYNQLSKLEKTNQNSIDIKDIKDYYGILCLMGALLGILSLII